MPRLTGRLLSLLLVCLASRTLTGQLSPPGPHRGYLATLAVVDAIPYPNADGVIIRSAASTPHDLILLRRNAATSAYVAEALYSLALVRARHGNLPDHDLVMRVPAPTVRRHNETSAALILETLRVAPSKQLPIGGNIPAVDIVVPPQPTHR